RTAGESDQAVGVAERRSCDGLPAGEELSSPREPLLCLVGPARSDQCPGSRHDERNKQRALAGRAGECPAFLGAGSSSVWIAGDEVSFGETPERHEDELHLPDAAPNLERFLEPA